MVGAGPGGLASALLLSKRGFDVAIYEKSAEVGGRSGRVRLGEYQFDVGSTLFMMKFMLDEIFELAELRLEEHLTFIPLDPMYRLQGSGHSLDVFTDPERMRAELASKFPGEEAGLDRFLLRERRRMEKLFPCLQLSFSSLAGLARGKVLSALPHLNVHRSLYDTMGDYFRPDFLKLAFSFQSAYLGMSPWDCPGGFGIIPYVEHAYGIHHVEGGISAVFRKMAELVERQGGRVATSTPVRRVITSGGRATGLELEDGSQVESDEVVLNADFAGAAQTLFEPGVLPSHTPEKLARMKYSCSTFMLYLGLDKTYPMPHHTFVFSESYRDEMKALFGSPTLGADFSMYICNPSVSDPTMAPPGHSSLYVLVLVPNLGTAPLDWETERAGLRQRTIDLLENRAGYAGLSGHIKAEASITPEDWRRQLGVHLGAVFNFSHLPSQLLAFRPPHRLKDLSNVYLAGGGTSPGSGLPTILESARIASDLICRKHGVETRPPLPLPEPRAHAGRA